MINLNELFKKLLGSDGHNAQIVKRKTLEAEGIKQSIHDDMLRIKKKVDRVNKNTNTKLNEISADISTVTYRIAIVTGAKRRGLK